MSECPISGDPPGLLVHSFRLYIKARVAEEDARELRRRADPSLLNHGPEMTAANLATYRRTCAEVDLESVLANLDRNVETSVLSRAFEEMIRRTGRD